MGLWGQAVVLLAEATNRRRPGVNRWLSEPRNAVFLVLASTLLIGGGRKLLHAWRSRAAVARLTDPNVAPADVSAAVDHGRAGLTDLFRILGTSDSGPLRDAAGNALAALWSRDDLIAEEEKALVRRGFVATWLARRRYPRGLRSPISVSIAYGVPFLRDRDGEVGPGNLEWSHRIVGARRAALETFSDWKAGPASAEFTLVPDDFESNGPHRLVLHARVRTSGLTDSWELELPQVPFHFELDPNLAVDALLALADGPRGEEIARAVRLQGPESDGSGGPVFLDLNPEMALRDPPALVVATPLPRDLAHGLEIEIEGVPDRLVAGAVVLSGQGVGRDPSGARSFALGPLAPIRREAVERPGRYRLRAILTPNPDLGWADPDVRSIWPGTIETPWVEVQVVRR